MAEKMVAKSGRPATIWNRGELPVLLLGAGPFGVAPARVA